MYDKVICDIRDKREICKHYSGRYGAPGMPREKKKKKTPEEMAKQNYWRRCRELRRTIELNFGEGDLHVVLTCRPGARPEKEETAAVIRSFRDKLRREYRRQGWEFKYIITCETGERGAVHWHMIVNNMHSGSCSTTKLINRIWTRGRPYFTALDGTGDYKKLAEYIVKESDKRIKREETGEKLSYMSSRNLIRPQERTEKIRANAWRKEPGIPKGWELVEGTLVNGINRFTGLPYQHYTIRKILESKKGESTDAGGGYICRDKPPGTGTRDRKGHVCDAVQAVQREGP